MRRQKPRTGESKSLTEETAVSFTLAELIAVAWAVEKAYEEYDGKGMFRPKVMKEALAKLNAVFD